MKALEFPRPYIHQVAYHVFEELCISTMLLLVAAVSITDENRVTVWRIVLAKDHEARAIICRFPFAWGSTWLYMANL